MTHDERMTNAQHHVVDASVAIANHFEQLLDLAKEARDARVSLPHVNESGKDVIHKCNIAMGRIAETYYTAALALAQGMDRELADSLAAQRGFTLHGEIHRIAAHAGTP